jgi:hypothetical protein
MACRALNSQKRRFRARAVKRPVAAWDKVVGVELYAHDDRVDARTGGLARGCLWAMERENLAHRAAHADVAKKLAATLRSGWRMALPKSSEFTEI